MSLQSTIFMLLFSLYRSALTAAPLSLSSLSTLNITVPFSDIPPNPSLSARPHDPLELTTDWLGPGFVGVVTVTFSHYGADIPPPLALYCTSLAIRDARINHRSEWNQAIAKSELLYTKPPLVVLAVLPRAAMTWNMLFYSMLLVDQFARDDESMAFHFDVEISGMQGLMATGNLSIVPEFGS